MERSRKIRRLASLLCALLLLLGLPAQEAHVAAADESSRVPEEKNMAESVSGGLRAAVSDDLADFLIDVQIDAPTDEDGNYLISPNSAYEITLAFRESEAVQFDDAGDLFYELPAGLIPEDLFSGAFSVKIKDSLGEAVMEDNFFEVRDGRIRVKFNQDDPNFERFRASANAQFSLSFSSRFDQSAGEITFREDLVKRFIYEDKSDLIITKSVRYDSASDTAWYTLTVTSKGLNENIVITDQITGTALTFNRDVAAESGGAPLSLEPDYDSVENGFAVTIPQLADGEELVLRYSAAVNNNLITGKGTVAQTGNTARVTSSQLPDGKQASADFSGQVTFHKLSKNLAGELETLPDGTVSVPWRIEVNRDHKMIAGGRAISDWIDTASRPFMHFSGEGIAVLVTFEDGRTETRALSWADLVSHWDDKGIIGWEYVPPESDGKASYRISCTALVDPSAAYGDLTVTNHAEFEGSGDSASATVPAAAGTDTVTAQKAALSNTAEETEWQITVTVPGAGLPDLMIVDDLPRLDYEGQTYIDTLIDGSLSVSGLQEGERYEFSLSSTNRTFTLTFYQGESSSDTGLSPTPDGAPRMLTLRFRTRVSQDWLDLAVADNYTASRLYLHRNNMSARVGSFRVADNASVIPVRPEIRKEAVSRSETEVDGITYPVFTYSIGLLGPTEDGAVIRDAFDTAFLRWQEAAGIRILGGNDLSPDDPDGEISAAETADGLLLTVSRFPKKPDGSFYPYYRIDYSLIVRDEEALKQLNELAAQQEEGITLSNTAYWNALSSDTVNVTYMHFPYVDKELITRPDAENGYVAEFRILINQYGEDLDPTSDTLTIQDVLSENLRLLPDTLSITPAAEGIEIGYDADSRTLTVSGLSDGMPFSLSYQARVLGQGNTTYSNTVKFGKFEKTVQDTVVLTSSGVGSASNPSITLVKRDAQSLSDLLAGARFELYYISDGETVPVRGSDGGTVSFTTGADGRVLIEGNLQQLGWTLWADRTYCLIETAAPEGYELSTEPVCFILTEMPAGPLEYDLTGDLISVTNDRIVPPETTEPEETTEEGTSSETAPPTETSEPAGSETEPEETDETGSSGTVPPSNSSETPSSEPESETAEKPTKPASSEDVTATPAETKKEERPRTGDTPLSTPIIRFAVAGIGLWIVLWLLLMDRKKGQ